MKEKEKSNHLLESRITRYKNASKRVWGVKEWKGWKGQRYKQSITEEQNIWNTPRDAVSEWGSSKAFSKRKKGSCGLDLEYVTCVKIYMYIQGTGELWDKWRKGKKGRREESAWVSIISTKGLTAERIWTTKYSCILDVFAGMKSFNKLHVKLLQ